MTNIVTASQPVVLITQVKILQGTQFIYLIYTMHLALDKQADSEILQKDLGSLEKWEKLWDMSFNPSKCQVMHLTRCKTPFHTKYLIHGCELENVPSAKYPGVTISEDLKWTDHIKAISKKANQTLGFLKRNIRVHNRDLKSTA